MNWFHRCCWAIAKENETHIYFKCSKCGSEKIEIKETESTTTATKTL